jgi:hypothetical protein
MALVTHSTTTASPPLPLPASHLISSPHVRTIRTQGPPADIIKHFRLVDGLDYFDIHGYKMRDEVFPANGSPPSTTTIVPKTFGGRSKIRTIPGCRGVRSTQRLRR